MLLLKAFRERLEQIGYGTLDAGERFLPALFRPGCACFPVRPAKDDDSLVVVGYVVPAGSQCVFVQYPAVMQGQDGYDLDRCVLVFLAVLAR